MRLPLRTNVEKAGTLDQRLDYVQHNCLVKLSLELGHESVLLKEIEPQTHPKRFLRRGFHRSHMQLSQHTPRTSGSLARKSTDKKTALRRSHRRASWEPPDSSAGWMCNVDVGLTKVAMIVHIELGSDHIGHSLSLQFKTVVSSFADNQTYNFTITKAYRFDLGEPWTMSGNG